MAKFRAGPRITPEQKRLVQWLADERLKQTDIGEDVGLGQAQISQILIGKVESNSKGVRALCR